MNLENICGTYQVNRPNIRRQGLRPRGTGLGDSSENTSVFTIHPDAFEVPISLRERFGVVVHIVYRGFVNSACTF